MEPGTLRSTKEGLCATCYAKADVKCSKCKQRWYCSSYCQAKDWHLGHKGDCGLQDLRIPDCVPAPPSRLLPESVQRPVHSDSTWRKLVECTELGAREGPPRGLKNVGNSCYMNAVLQGLHHGVPVLQSVLRQHAGRDSDTAASSCRCQRGGPPSSKSRTAWGTATASTAAGGCFRCDLETVSSSSLDPRPRITDGQDDSDTFDFCIGDAVVLHGLGAADLNDKEGVLVSLPATNCPAEEARCGVRLAGHVTKAVRPQNIRLRCRAASGPPPEVVRWLPRLGEEFTFGAQEDAHEFLRSLLRLLEDEELKEHAETLRLDSTEAPAPNADLTAAPKRIFGGLLVSQCTCTKRDCVASSFSFEPFMDLSLDITEATDSVEDALQLFTAAEKLDKTNLWKCDSCGETVRARKQLTIYSPPSFLALHLKRFRHGERGKVTRPVQFSAELNLRPFLCSGSPEAGRPVLYELRAIIVHLDKLGYSSFGHYVSYVRCAGERKGSSSWFLVDDSQTTEVPEAEVLRQQAYLLFYARTGSASEVSSGSRRTDSKAAAAVDDSPAGSAAMLPSKCRGHGGAICSFFASSDGLCTGCYKEVHGRPPPAPSPPSSEGTPLSGAAVSALRPPAANGSSTSGKSTSGKPAAATAGKANKKVGANDLCPCGSGKKYKKCHGSA